MLELEGFLYEEVFTCLSVLKEEYVEPENGIHASQSLVIQHIPFYIDVDEKYVYGYSKKCP